ncbi:MAG TPA: transcription antitermination factor NusB [Tepidisphaeraceae bacterium]|nr:transcription antitermination factor NusB [Tepidisphaeraceae bacterium]
MSTARDYALWQLDRSALPGWRANRTRRRVEPPSDPRDLALAEQIRVGVIKNLIFLQYLIGHYAERSKIDDLVRKILCIGLFQLRFLDRIPPSAAVDEAVNQARRFGRSTSAGFVNAVLRRATREPNVPLPDKQIDPRRYAEIVLSHPPELFDRLSTQLGQADAIRFCEHDNSEPPTLARLFSGILIEQLQIDGVTIQPHEQSGIVIVESARRATFANWAARGLAQVQDATAAAVINHLDLRPGQSVLDRCAGLGTKTFQVRDLIGDSGSMMAVDPAHDRCKALRDLIQLRRIANIAVVESRLLREVVDLEARAFDRILVDAPCSNSGVLARRPEARYSQTPQALESLASLQNEILNDTAAYLRPDGLLAYSTCSIWPEENEDRIKQFLQTHRDYEMVSMHSTLPGLSPAPTTYHDGGFVAVLRRK